MANNQDLQPYKFELWEGKLKVVDGDYIRGIYSREALIERINEYRRKLSNWEYRLEVFDDLVEQDIEKED